MKCCGFNGASRPRISESERLLFAQCSQTYLRFWSYANVFRNQGEGVARGGDGKELCDLLIVFGDAVVIFSDKACQFPDTGDAELDWTRWKRRAIDNAKKQLLGAEKWLREAPDRLFLDQRCTIPFPLKFPPADRIKIFRCVVASGASERIRRHYKGVSASLVQLAQPASFWAGGKTPVFGVEVIDELGRTFHLFDETTLPLLLEEIDTLPDLLEYLEAKERMIKAGSFSVITGEEEIIGVFLGIRAGIGELEIPAGYKAVLAEGIYADVISRPQYKAYKKANEPSYFWDSIIAYHVNCTLAGRLLSGSPTSVASNEEIVRFLAAESRIYRRLLSQAFLDLYIRAPRDQISSRRITGHSSTTFVFQIHPFNPRTDTAVHREERQGRLLAYCLLTQWRLRTTNPVVGICVAGIAPGRDGFEIIAVEQLEPWTDKAVEEFRPIAEDYERELTPRGIWEIGSGPTMAWRPSASSVKGSNRRHDPREGHRKRRREERKRKR